MYVRLAIGALLTLVATACGSERGEARADQVSEGVQATANPPRAEHPTRTTQRFASADLRSAIDARVKGAAPASVTAAQWRCVRALYDRTAAAPVWIDSAGGGARARALLRQLVDASSHGLVVAPAAIDSLRVALSRSRNASAT